VFDKQYEFMGKHAEMVLALRSDSSGGTTESHFRRFMDVYLIAPLVGFLYGRKAELDAESKAEPRSIFAETIISEKERLALNYHLIMLLDGRKEMDINERVGRTFRETNEELLSENLALYESYVRGGVEVLYEKLIGTAKTEEEWIGNMIDFVSEFRERFNDGLKTCVNE
jgi:hypothetical protein